MAKTIKELSEICGVSEQAIRGWCRKNQVAKLAKGKGFAINESAEMAILRHYGATNAKNTKANESNSESANETCETLEMLKILQKELDFCKLQLEEKDRQLKEKDKQIERLQQELENAQKQTDQAQQLHAMTEQKLHLIEAASTEDSRTEKKHWWNRKKTW